MELGWLLSNAVQQSGKPEAPGMVSQFASVSSLITTLGLFKIINLVMETATQIIVGESFLRLLQSYSVFRALSLISARLCHFILHYKRVMLSLLLRFCFRKR
jgi:hypothetical protein